MNQKQGYILILILKDINPIQSVEIFGLINSTDGNFWFISEDDDYYWTTAEISEETIRKIRRKRK